MSAWSQLLGSTALSLRGYVGRTDLVLGAIERSSSLLDRHLSRCQKPYIIEGLIRKHRLHTQPGSNKDTTLTANARTRMHAQGRKKKECAWTDSFRQMGV